MVFMVWKRRLIMLEFAPCIIQHTKNIHAHRISKNHEYWAIRRKIGKTKQGITVIIRKKMKNGKLVFHSIMQK